MFKPTAYLPDPFLLDNGSRITSAEQWSAQADAIRHLAEAHMYGNWPGLARSVVPTFHHTEDVYDGKAVREQVTVRINDQFDMKIIITRPADHDPKPYVVIIGQDEWFLTPEVDEAVILQAGYAVAIFDRESIRPDHTLTEEEKSSYPELDCGTIMAWGWGYSLTADYLQTRSDCAHLICTGHSRSGKSALCAGIFDDRFEVVAPTGSGCGGTGSARFLGTLDGSRQDSKRCESVGSITHKFPYWFGGDYVSFGTDEPPYPVDEKINYFPLDAHMLRAACAPRAVISAEGTEDYWSNLFGTQLCWQAAQPVFELLGVPERNGLFVRPGRHAYTLEDWKAVIDFCNIVLGRQRVFPDMNVYQTPIDMDVEAYAPWMKE